MKRAFLLTCLLFTVSFSSATEGKAPLAAFIRTELTAYYGLADFSDSTRSTGWYRVADVLSWVEENEKEILNKPVFINFDEFAIASVINLPRITARERDKILITIAALYVKSRPVKVCLEEDVFFNLSQKPLPGGVYFDLDSKEINIPPGLSAPALFNSIVHELGHTVTYKCHKDEHQWGAFTEASPYYFTTMFALPIKPRDGQYAYIDGVRDMAAAFRAGVPPEILIKEYSSFALGPLIKEYMDAQFFDVLNEYCTPFGSEPLLLKLLSPADGDSLGCSPTMPRPACQKLEAFLKTLRQNLDETGADVAQDPALAVKIFLDTLAQNSRFIPKIPPGYI